MLGWYPTKCCGITELHDLLEINESSLADKLNLYFQPTSKRLYLCHILFSDIRGRSNGERLKNIIKEHSLGEVVETKSKKNPNSDNWLTAYLWTVEKENVLLFIERFKTPNYYNR